MGRPRQYGSPAARQAAYRQRLRESTVPVDRQTLELLDTRLAQLQDAVAPLARHGDPLALRMFRCNLVTLLEHLTDWCQEQTARPSPAMDANRPPLPRASRLGSV